MPVLSPTRRFASELDAAGVLVSDCYRHVPSQWWGNLSVEVVTPAGDQVVKS